MNKSYSHSQKKECENNDDICNETCNTIKHFVSMSPQSFDTFFGQEKILEQLSVLTIQNDDEFIIPHLLICGAPGTGKTSLASLLGKQIGKRTVIIQGPSLDKVSTLVGLLMNVGAGDIIFLDEIHSLSRPIEECLYGAMDCFSIDLIVGNNTKKNYIKVPVGPFTLVGATTRLGKISSPLRSRFGLIFHMEPYSLESICLILKRSSNILKINISKEAILEIAKRCRESPRQANHLLRWIKSFASAKSKPSINASIVRDALSVLGIDEFGLTIGDIKILTILVQEFSGGPVGISALASLVEEDVRTIEEVYEPYLLRSGFLKKTPSGRIATVKAFEHIQS